MKAGKGMQDLRSANLSVEGIKQRNSEQVDVPQKSRLELAKARHAVTLAQLNSMKKVLETMQGGSISLVTKRNMADIITQEDLPLSCDVEGAVEVLILELMKSRESLASAHAACMEAGEQRLVLALATDEDAFICREKLKQAKEKILRLKERILMAKNLKSELESVSNKLLRLQNDLTSYMMAKIHEESGSKWEGDPTVGTAESKKTEDTLERTSNRSDTDVEEVRTHTDEAILKVEAMSLKSELADKKYELATMKQREEMTSVVVLSLQAELERTISELNLAKLKENEAKQRMVRLPKALQQTDQEVDEAKSSACLAWEKLRKAREKAAHSKASAITLKARLRAVSKETEGLRASEGLALAAVRALEESCKQAASSDDSLGGVHLSLKEYHLLINEARDAESSADERVAVALSRMEEAMDSELRISKKLLVMNRELGERKEAARVATKKAEKAEERKLAAEQEFQARRSEHDQRMIHQGETTKGTSDTGGVPPWSFEKQRAPSEAGPEIPVGSPSPATIMQENGMDDAVARSTAKKKAIFPNLATFFARRKRLSGRTLM